MPRWIKVFLLAGLVLVLLLVLSAGALLAVLRSDEQRLGQALELGLGYLLQRELVIGEVLEAELDWDAYLLARDVRLSNPEWAGDLEFASARELMIRINLPSIWQEGPVLIHEAELDGARLNLLLEEGHAPSWDFWPGQEEPEPGEITETVEFPVVITTGRLQDSEILYRDHDRHVRIRLNGELGERKRSDLVHLDLRGTINDIPLSGRGEVGPKAALLSGRDVQIDLGVEWGGLTIKSSGSLRDLPTLAGPDLSLVASAPTSRPLLDMLGMPEVRDGPLLIEATITDGEPGWAIDARASLEEFDTRLSGRVERPLQLDGLHLSADLNGPSLAELGAMLELPGLPEVPYAVSGELERKGRLLVLHRGRIEAGDALVTAQGVLPGFPDIDDWQAKLHAQRFNLALVGPLIGMQGLPEVPYNLQATLASDDQGVELVNVTLTGEGSSLVASGIVGEAPAYQGTRVKAEMKGPDMAAVGRSLGLYNLPPERFRLAGELVLQDEHWQIVDVHFDSDDLRLTLNGFADHLFNPRDVIGTIHATSPDLAQTLAAYGIEREQLRGFPVQAEIALKGSRQFFSFEQSVVRSGANRIILSGDLGNPANFEGLDMQVDLQGPDLLELLRLQREDLTGQLPFALAGRVFLDDEGLGVEKVSGRIGEAELRMDGLLATGEDFAGSRLQLEASGPSWGLVVDPWLTYQSPVLPFDAQLEVEYLPPLFQLPKLALRVGDNQLSGHLDLQGSGDSATGQGELLLRGPRSNEIARLLGAEPFLPDGPYTLSSKVLSRANELRLEQFALEIGKSDLEGRMALGLRPGRMPVVDIDMSSDMLYVPFLLPDLEQRQKEEAEREARGEAFDNAELMNPLTRAELAERVIPDTPLDVSWLRDLELELDLELREIYMRENARSKGWLALSAHGGTLRTRRVEWDGNFSAGKGELTLKQQGEAAAIDLYLDSRRIPMFWLLTGEQDLSRESVYRLELQGQGRNMRELAASLDGTFVFQGGGGRMDNKGLDLFLGDILGEVFTRVNPHAQTETYTDLECLAGAMVVEDGVLKSVPGAVLRTDKLDILSSGSLDFHTERIDMVFNTRSRKGIGISASKAITPYIKMGGNLANPQLALNVKGAALSGGAAVATGGLSILAEGLWDRWVATARNPCDVLFERAKEDPGKDFRALLGRP